MSLWGQGRSSEGRVEPLPEWHQARMANEPAGRRSRFSIFERGRRELIPTRDETLMSLTLQALRRGKDLHLRVENRISPLVTSGPTIPGQAYCFTEPFLRRTMVPIKPRPARSMA